MARTRIPLTARERALIERLAGQGLNVTQMSAILGMSKKTFERRMRDTKGASDALEKGRAEAARRVTKTAFKMAVSGQAPAMTMFWLKCRERWTERQVIEHTGKDGGPIETREIAQLTDEQLDARIAAKLEKPGPQES